MPHSQPRHRPAARRAPTPAEVAGRVLAMHTRLDMAISDLTDRIDAVQAERKASELAAEDAKIPAMRAKPNSVWRESGGALILAPNTMFVYDGKQWWTCPDAKDAWERARELSEKVFKALRESLVEVSNPEVIRSRIGLPELERDEDEAIDAIADLLPMDYGDDVQMSNTGGFRRGRLTPAQIREGVRQLGGR